MSKDLNQCNFIGRLGKEIEVSYMASGNAVAKFSIACGDDYKDKQGQKVEQTNWINIVAFGRLAEICGEYLSKGSQVFVSGKQVTRKWQDQSGQDRYTTEIVASEMQMLGARGNDAGNAPAQSGNGGGQGGKSRQQQRPQQQAQQAPPRNFDDFDDDIPF